MAVFWVVAQLILAMVLLAWSSDRFLHASISLAKRWNWSPLVVGMVLVGFGTSFPELVVSFFASIKGTPSVAIGNVFGSNTINFLMVFGLSACLFPIAVKRSLWKSDFPWLIGVTVILAFIVYSAQLSLLTGAFLIALLVLIVWVMIHRSRKNTVDLDAAVQANPMRFSTAVIWWFLGLVLIAVASEWLIHSSIIIAHWAGLSDLVIGLTVVTLGTSLPELAATLVSAWRKQSDIALGHLIGSNIFNSTAVLAMPAIFAPGRLPVGILTRDYPFMLGVTVLMWGLLAWQCRRSHFSRWLAAGLLLLYVGYLIFMFQ